MKIISLIDNECTNNRLYKEHGLSLYIEVDGIKILFDTGSSNNFIKNSNTLNIDLLDIDYVVISHGHYDHTGGLLEFLKLNSKAKVILKKQCNNQFYSRKTFYYRYIGMNTDIFKLYKDRFLFIDEDYKLNKNITIITNIDKKFDNTSISKQLFMLDGNVIRDDTFKHELILTILNNDKVTMITGCSHNGILNMIYTVNKKFNNIPIKNVIGGFHLKSLSNDSNYICNLGKRLSSIKNIEKFYTCHCTGLKAYNQLKTIMKDKLLYLGTGDQIE